MISSNPKLGHWNEFQNYHRHLFKIKIKNRELIETDIILFPVWKQCPSWKDQSLDWEIKKNINCISGTTVESLYFLVFPSSWISCVPLNNKFTPGTNYLKKKTVIYESSK